MDENNVNMNKNTKKGLMIGGIVVVLLLLIGMLTYFLMPVKPKKVFTIAIERVYESSKENSQVTNTLGGKYTIETDIHSDKTNEEKILEIINNLKISMNYGMDTKDKKMHISLNSDYKDKELLNASIDIQDSNAYVFLQDIYSKQLLVPIEGMDEMFKTFEKANEYEVILKHVKNALDKSLKEEYFSKKNTTITLNGKSTKVIDNQLILNEKNVKEITSVLSDELNNEEFIKSFSTLTDYSEEETKELLMDLKNEEIDLEDGTLIVSIYTKGLQNKFVGLSIHDESDTISILKNKETNYSYEIKVEDKNYKGGVDIKVKDNNINLKVSFDIEGISGSITMDFVENKNISLPKTDTNNTISIENLNESEAMEILNNLQNKEGIVELVQTITSLNSIGFNF